MTTYSNRFADDNRTTVIRTYNGVKNLTIDAHFHLMSGNRTEVYVNGQSYKAPNFKTFKSFEEWIGKNLDKICRMFLNERI